MPVPFTTFYQVFNNDNHKNACRKKQKSQFIIQIQTNQQADDIIHTSLMRLHAVIYADQCSLITDGR